MKGGTETGQIVYSSYSPTVSSNEEVCASEGGTEAGQSVYSRWRGWCPLCK